MGRARVRWLRALLNFTLFHRGARLPNGACGITKRGVRRRAQCTRWQAPSAALLSWYHGARLVRTRARVVGKRARALLYFTLYSIEVRGLGSVLPSEGYADARNVDTTEARAHATS